MKIYHTETQEDYDALMVELEAKGVKIYDKEKLESSEIPNYFGVHKYRSCIMVDGTTALYNQKGYYEFLFPDVQIIKYKAKADEKMRFTKENVKKVIDEYFCQADFESCGDLIAEIHNLDDTPEKVAVPKFVADVFSSELHFEYEIQESRDIPHVLSAAFSEVSSNKNIKFLKWVKQHPDKYVMAVKYGYEVEKEPLYHVVNKDGGLMLFNKCDGVVGATPSPESLTKDKYGHKPYYQLTEKEIKDYDERYWPFAVPAND